MGAKPKVPSIRGQDDSDSDSSEALFDTKADNTFFDANDKPLTHTHIGKKNFLFILLHDESFMGY